MCVCVMYAKLWEKRASGRTSSADAAACTAALLFSFCNTWWTKRETSLEKPASSSRRCGGWQRKKTDKDKGKETERQRDRER